jgi:hypothetical protein
MISKVAAALSAGLMFLAGISLPAAHAGGVGFYFSAGGGESETERETAGTPREIREDEETRHRGFGFTFDTNLAQPQKIFNYRMSLGYERIEFKVDDAASLRNGFETEVNGFALEQDFGFGGRIGERVRLWGGPCLRLSYHHGDDEDNGDYKFAGIGVGPVIGLNVGVGGPVTLSLRGGYLVTGYGGRWNRPGDVHRDYSASEDYFFLTLSTLFGVGE